MAEVELVMPRMGESIIEATIIGWLKKEGDRVEAEESILEIATDKVDSEVPSPVGGVIKKIFHHKDEVIPVDQVIALIETEELATPTAPSQIVPSQEDVPEVSLELSDEGSAKDVSETTVSSVVPSEEKKGFKQPLPLARKSQKDRIPSTIGGRFFSPLVRNIARAEGLTAEELESIPGSGAHSRVTKFDLYNYLDKKKAQTSNMVMGNEPQSRILHQQEVKSDTKPIKTKNQQIREPEVISDPSKTTTPYTPISTNTGDEIIELDRMRKVIARHMVNSLSTSAHVTSFVEADATKLVNWRNRIKDDYLSKYGQKLTLSPLFTEVVIQALRDFPRINASLQDDKLIIKKAINIGIATAMENGNLIVPVIRNAGQLNLHGLTQRFNDITSRARTNQLTPDEIQGGTFTISNIGTFGNIMGTPIINQPELAVLALGAIKKKPVIRETPEGDIIAIRHMMFLSLSFDHRVIDGYKGGIFLNRIAHYIENFDSNRPL